MLLPVTTGDIDEVTQPALLEQGQVGCRGESRVEDDDRLGPFLPFFGKQEPVQHPGQGCRLGDVALENLVGQGQSALVESHAHGHLAAIGALLFVLAVPGFRIAGAQSLEMRVGHVVEDHPAPLSEEVFLACSQGGLGLLARLEKGVAGQVEPVLGAFGHADIEHFGQRGAFGPPDERPFAQRLDETVGHEQLRGGDLAGIEARFGQGGGEAQFFPGLEGDELRPELHDILGGDAIEEHAIDPFQRCRTGGLGASGEFEDAGDPVRRRAGEFGLHQTGLAGEAVLDGACDEMCFTIRKFCITERGDDALARLALGIAVGFDELDQWRALDGFGAEEHTVAQSRGGWKKSRERNEKLGTTKRHSRHYPLDFQRNQRGVARKLTGIFCFLLIFKKLGLVSNLQLSKFQFPI
jgi:hypothetical protein